MLDPISENLIAISEEILKLRAEVARLTAEAKDAYQKGLADGIAQQYADVIYGMTKGKK